MPTPIKDSPRKRATSSTKKTTSHSSPRRMVELRWSGDLDLSRAAQLHREVRTAFETADDITVDLRGIGLLDLSFLQILVAASRTAAQGGKRLHLRCAEADAPRLREVWRQAGLEPEYEQILQTSAAVAEGTK